MCADYSNGSESIVVCCWKIEHMRTDKAYIKARTLAKTLQLHNFVIKNLQLPSPKLPIAPFYRNYFVHPPYPRPVPICPF